jgi:hypothetical protein
LALIGALLLTGALSLGGGSALLVWALLGLARWPLRVAALVGLYLLPGLALLRLLWPRERALAMPARLALALGLSVALPPLLLLLFHLIRLPWGAVATWVYLLVSLFVVLGLGIRDWRLGNSVPIPNRQSPIANFDGASFALLGISLAALLVRLYVVRDLPTGLLGDSYHHTLIAQLLVDKSGIFSSWQPYAPLTTFTYHFGFHANVAFVHYVTGMDLPQSLLWAGQIINAIIVPLVFALALALGRSAWAGVWAAVIVGFASNLPAYFVNWGRYTQLTGQVVMIAALVCWITLAEQTNDERRTTNNPLRRSAVRPSSFVVRQFDVELGKLLVLTVLATAALILTHYLITALAALMIGSYLLGMLLARRSWSFASALLLRAGLAGVLALLLVAPWLLNVLGGHLVRNAAGFAAGTAQSAVPLSTLEPLVPKYAGGAVLLFALAGLLMALWRREWRMALPAVWCVLLVIAVVPYLVGLPGTGVLDTLTSLGTLYLPAALLAGYVLALAQTFGAALLARLHAPPGLGAALVGALLLLVVAANTGWQMRVVTGETALVLNADMAAMQWIRENTPPESRFVINSFPAYAGTLAAGTDAGWWIPLLAHRATTLPPLTYGSEKGERSDYQMSVNALAKKLRGRDLTDSTPLSIDLSRSVALKTLDSNEIAYVYIGAQAYPGPDSADWIDPDKLRTSPFFRLVYDHDGVKIFQFLKGPK